MNWIRMTQINTDRKTLKRFGLTMSVLLLIVAALLFFRQRQVYLLFYVTALLFLISGLLAPDKLKSVYILWMRFAYGLSWVNTRIVLTLVFFIIFTPLGLIMRLFRRDPLERKLNRQEGSYWKDYQQTGLGASGYQRQF